MIKADQHVTIKATGVSGSVVGSWWNHAQGAREYLVRHERKRAYSWHSKSELEVR